MFDAEINRALTAAVDLMNTAEGLHSAKSSPDRLTSIESLKKFISEQDSALKWPSSSVDRQQVDKVRELRGNLRDIWTATPVTDDEPVNRLNRLLEGVGTKVVRTNPDSSAPEYRSTPIPVSNAVADVMTATIADAIQFLVVNDETGRMRVCKGEDCDAVIVDLTRNRSKLFCDFGNCANRAHVRAYRARQAALRDAGKRALASEAQSKKSSLEKPSSAEKAAQLNEPTSESALAAKEFRDRMRDELMEKRDKKEKKNKKKSGKKKAKK